MTTTKPGKKASPLDDAVVVRSHGDGQSGLKHSDLPRVLRRAVGLMRFSRAAVGASAASLFLVDADVTSLRGIVSEWDWTRTSFPSHLTDWPSVHRALMTGEVCEISAAEAVGGEAGWFEPRGIASTIVVPLRAADAPLGVLFFDRGAGSAPLDRPAHALLSDVGGRIARAIARSPVGDLGARPDAKSSF